MIHDLPAPRAAARRPPRGARDRARIHSSMASNYNVVPRPAAVLVTDGEARLISRRETIDDLLELEVP